LQTASREQRLIFFEDGRVEQSPQATWKLIASGVQEMMAGRHPSQVKAIALSVHRGTVIPLTANGEPLSDFIVWMDKRGLTIAQEVASRIAPGAILQCLRSSHLLYHWCEQSPVAESKRR